MITDYTVAYNQGDFEKLFGDLTTPGMQFENRSRSVFPDRSVDEFRASVEELSSMVSSSRTWSSAICWMSTSCCVSRLEREAIGQEGERYSWTTIYVSEVRNGRVAAVRQFDLEDEEAAFAYAEERIRASTSRLAVTNRSCELVLALNTAMQAHDIDGIMRCMSEHLVYDDRRRLTGDPIVGQADSEPLLGGSWSSTATSTIAFWRCGVSASICTGAVGRMPPATRRRTYMWSRSATTGCRSTRAASTRTISRAPTANSTAATYGGEGAAFAEAGATATNG